ncbi:MAG: class I SAM-dependent methyltransferase [Euryarchaeota archaeon]|nr:class I SAM-dependent methyltransferase [Euryarchaeota archaeon]
MHEIDFEKEWATMYEEREQTVKRKTGGIAVWDKAAERFSESRKLNEYEYGRKAVETLREVITPESEVLEIGAGPGTLVIPFARKVRSVTAVEPSEGMIEYLRTNAEEAGIANFEIIPRKWEDVDPSVIAGRFDLVISTTVAWMFKDVWSYLEQMEKASKGYCCLVEGIGGYREGRFDELWQKVTGKDYSEWSKTYPEPSLFYNILYNRGRYANVGIINYATQRPVDSWVTFMEDFFESYTEMTPEIKKIIKEHATETAEDGLIRSENSAAVIWWKAMPG